MPGHTHLLPALPKQKLDGEERAVGPKTAFFEATRVKSMRSCEEAVGGERCRWVVGGGERWWEVRGKTWRALRGRIVAAGHLLVAPVKHGGDMMPLAVCHAAAWCVAREG